MIKINFLLLLVITLTSINTQAFENNRVFKKIPEDKAFIFTRPTTSAGIKHLVFSPSDPDIIYTITAKDDTLYKSEDGGDQWEKVNQEDGWEKINQEEEWKIVFSSLLVSPTNPQVLLINLLNSKERWDHRYRIVRSEDGGKHWTKGDLLFTSPITTFNTPIAPLLRAIVLVDTDNDSKNKEKRIATSSDTGETWQISETPISNIDDNAINILAIDPNNSMILYGEKYFETRYDTLLYKSFDGGAHWNKISVGTHPSFFGESHKSYISLLMVHPKNSNLLYYKTRNGVSRQSSIAYFRSDNAGLSWKYIEGGNFTTALNLIIHPLDEHILYTKNYLWYDNGGRQIISNYLSRSTDSGATWEGEEQDSLNIDLLSTDSETTVIVNPIDPDNLFAINRSNMARSYNGRVDWHIPEGWLKRELHGGFEATTNDLDTIYYMSTRFQRGWYYPDYFRSTTKGKEWEKFTILDKVDGYGGYCSDFLINPFNSQEISCQLKTSFVAESPKFSEIIITSPDAGKTWTTLVDGKRFTNPNMQVAYTSDSKTIYVSKCRTSSSPLSKLTKDGDAWQETFLGLNSKKLSCPSLILTDPIRPNIAYLILYNQSIYKTIDMGDSWREISSSNKKGVLFLINPKLPEQLILLKNNILLLSNDRGDSWVEFSTLPISIDSESDVSLIFNPKNSNGLFLSSEVGLFETRDLGLHWQRIKEGKAKNLQLFENSIFFNIEKEGDDDFYQLMRKPYTSENKDCLFNWAEQQYPVLFSPALANVQGFGDYSYRYYTATNTYLGFFKDDEVHYLEASQSGDIKKAGFMEQYMHLAECI